MQYSRYLEVASLLSALQFVCKPLYRRSAFVVFLLCRDIEDGFTGEEFTAGQIGALDTPHFTAVQHRKKLRVATEYLSSLVNKDSQICEDRSYESAKMLTSFANKILLWLLALKKKTDCLKTTKYVLAVLRTATRTCMQDV